MHIANPMRSEAALFIISNIKKLLGVLLIIALQSCTAAVFQPTHQFYYSPENTLKMTPDHFDIKITDNVSLHAWRFKAKDQKPKAVVVQFHGNAENISSHYLSVTWLLNYGYDVFTFDYRGYGMSTGIPSFPQVVTDGDKVMQFVQDLYKDQNLPIIVYGQSLGSLIAANVVKTSKVKVDQVVFEGGMYSLNQVSANILSKRWFTWPFQPMGYVLMSHRYNFKKSMDDYPKVPTLLLHSKKDPIISPKQSQRMYDKLTESKCLILVDEPAHINIGNIDKGKYRSRILDFLENKKCNL